MLLDQGPGSREVPRELTTPIEQMPLHSPWMEGVAERAQGIFHVEVLAREDVGVDDAAAGKRVNADVALSDEDESGEPGGGSAGDRVTEHVGRHDPSHANALGHAFQQPVETIVISEAPGGTSVGLIEEMGPEAHHRTAVHSRPRWGSTTMLAA